jgi:hypothetical protein
MMQQALVAAGLAIVLRLELDNLVMILTLVVQMMSKQRPLVMVQLLLALHA